jgi:hypothetical protein
VSDSFVTRDSRLQPCVMPHGAVIAAELLGHYRAIPIVGCLTDLRPSELFALERRRTLVGGNVRSDADNRA